jgi:hypothetical protein
VITPADVEYHTPSDADHLYAETNWFAFYVPEARINTVVYTMSRPGAGVQFCDISMCGALVADRGEMLYLDSQQALPAPERLGDYTTASGLRVRALNPPRDYRIDYVGYDDCEIHVDFEGLMDPFDTSDPAHSPKATADPDAHVAGTGMGAAYKGHFELTGHITGTLRYRGVDHEVDCVETMDHSWGDRPEIHQHPMGWTHAHFGRDLVVKWINHWHIEAPEDEQQPLAHGYVLQDGAVHGLVDLQLRTQRIGRVITGMQATATDVRGEVFELTGVAEVGGPMIPYTGSEVYGAQLRWTERRSGRQGYGFASDIQSVQDLTRRNGRRSGAAASAPPVTVR